MSRKLGIELKSVADQLVSAISDRQRGVTGRIDIDLSGHTPTDLEHIADELLSRARAGRGDAPAYSEEYLEARKYRRGETDSLEAESVACPELFDVWWMEIVHYGIIGKLTKRQVLFLGHRRHEATIREIAILTGWSRTTVSRDIALAAKVLEAQPYYGLWTELIRAFKRGGKAWVRLRARME